MRPHLPIVWLLSSLLPCTTALAQADPQTQADAAETDATDATDAETQADAAETDAGHWGGTGLPWHAEDRRFTLADWILSGVGAGVVITKHVLGPVGSERRGGVGFDEDARDWLRIERLGGRRLAMDVSDVLLRTLESYNLFDALVVVSWYRASPDLAWEMSLITLETLAVSAALQGTANILASRERPYGRRCGQGKPADSRDCDSNDRYYSFFSGHSTQAFSSAALMCTHHMHFPLYGGGAADTAACVSGLAAASATATLRVMADQHYASDVLTGAAVGLLTGLLLPRLLHYGFGHDASEKRQSQRSQAPRVFVLPTPTGISALGAF